MIRPPSWLPWRFPVYLLLACGTTWPAVLRLGREVPGAMRTDLANALWSTWFVSASLARGELPWRTTLLDPPGGGVLLVADPLGALLALPLVGPLGLPAAYGVVVLLHLALAGWAAHRFARALALDRGLPGEAVGLVAGLAYGTAPVLRSAVHNGTSEGIAGAWVALAAWACWRVAREGGAGRVLLAALALLLAALGSWYGAVCAFLFAGALALLGLPGRWRATLVPRLLALVLGAVLVIPLALGVRAAASAPDNLVRIKHERELASVRRSTGPADVRGFVLPGDFRSPDFRRISRYGEDFFHCYYLGWILLLGAGLALRQRRGTGFLWLAAGAGLVLAMGPVAVRDGSAWIVLQDRAIPLPYFLVEDLPGFSSLSLLYRLTQAPALALAVLAGLGFGALRGRWLWATAGAAILLEGRLLCPLASLPDTADATVARGVQLLAAEPRGIVLNHPVVGGRAYLYEQTVHGQPVAGTLNFPNNAVGMQVWQCLVDAAGQVEGSASPESLAAFRQACTSRARKLGVRYVVVHDDPAARPDVQDEAVRVLELAMEPLGAAGGADSDPTRVYRLW